MSFRRQLGQLRPSTTNAEVLFAPTENKPYTIDLILVTNSAGGSVTIEIYHDADGTTYDETTEILAGKSLSSGETFEFSPSYGISDYRNSGRLAVKASTANSAVFTAYGFIEGELL